MRCTPAVLFLLANLLFSQTNPPRTANEASNAWDKAHPVPSANASPDEIQAYYREKAQASAEWVALWPNDMHAWLRRLHILERLKSTTDQQLEETGDTLLKVAKEHPFPGILFNPYQADVAVAWTNRRLRPQQCLALAQEAARADEQMQIDNPSFTRQFLLVIAQNMMRILNLEIILGRQLQKPDVITSALNEMKSYIDAHPTIAAIEKGRYEWAAAQFAEEQGRKPDALLYYSQAFRDGGDEMGVDPSPEAHVRELWKNLGGSADGLQAWLANFSKPDASARAPIEDQLWNSLAKPLTAFRGTDSRGKLWTVGDLKEKRTLIFVWASWCRPCHDELPTIQKLFASFKDRTDPQVITVSIDEQPTAIRPVMDQKGYTFPVVFISQKDIDTMAGFSGVPRTWIVDTGGVIRLEAIGYSAALTSDQITQRLNAVK